MRRTEQRNPLSIAVLVVLLANAATASAQDPPRSGTYLIQSGTYREVGGIGGIYSVSLPVWYQTFVSLAVDAGGSEAELTFLDKSQHAVFRRLTNGIVAENVIRFQYATMHPYLPSLPAQVDYTITNAAGRLWISGSITSSPAGPDFPTVLEHLSVSARFTPALSIRVGNEVELSWSSASNQNYQLQYLSDLTQAGWAELGGPMQGNGTTNQMFDAVLPAPSQRYYRVLALP